MSPELERLIQLQQLDTAIDEARRTIAAHPQRLASADARLDEATLRVEAAKQRLKDNHDARRTVEKDVVLFQGRVSKFKDQLFEVKTNKEYTAMQHEIETAQKELGAVEEKLLERMMEGDVITAEVKQAEAALARDKKAIDAEKQALAAELSSVEASLAQATATRASILGTLEPRLLTLYDQVAKARKGVAICTATRDGLCSVCHVRLRPQVFQMVRHNDGIIQCESCHRILYYVPPAPPVQPAATHL